MAILSRIADRSAGFSLKLSDDNRAPITGYGWAQQTELWVTDGAALFRDFGGRPFRGAAPRSIDAAPIATAVYPAADRPESGYTVPGTNDTVAAIAVAAIGVSATPVFVLSAEFVEPSPDFVELSVAPPPFLIRLHPKPTVKINIIANKTVNLFFIRFS